MGKILKYLNEYNLWISHDLKYNMSIYKNLQERERSDYWEIIEEEYLSKYIKCIRIEFEWASTCLWQTRFPGSLTYGRELGYEFIGIPNSTIKKLEKWIGFHNDIGPERAEYTDFTEIDLFGKEVYIEIGRYLPNNYYFEFNYLKQIKKVGNEVIELEYNPRIRKILRI